MLYPQQSTLIAIGYALRATIGTATVVDGLACLPTLPASMQVTVGQGSIITASTVDGSAYGTLAADPSDPLVKMGINPFGSTSFTLTAPGTSGQTIAYLIEAQFLETDGLPVALPYYNAANPSQPFTGPNNNQAQQNTVRTQRVGLQLKAGAAAAAGTQQTPGTDAGWVGLYVINVNFAQTTIIGQNISLAPGAPFIAAKIPQLAPLLSPGLLGVGTSTTPPVGDNSTRIATTAYVTGFGRAPNTTILSTPGIGAFTVPPGVFRLKETAIGGGGAGGGSSATNSAQYSVGSGGGAGSISISVLSVTPGQVLSYTVGAPGVPASGQAGGTGGTTVIGAITAPGGGGGQTTLQANTVTAISPQGAPGALATGGNLINTAGNPGTCGLLVQIGAQSGQGGGSLWGGGGPNTANTAGSQATCPGAGGGGAGSFTNSGPFPGGVGGAGMVMIEW